MMEKTEMENILMSVQVGRLGVCSDNKPYVIPMIFAYSKNKIYFHSGKKGKKVRAMLINRAVCFEVDEYILVQNTFPCKFTMKYRSVIASGRVRFLRSNSRKMEVLKVIMDKYDPRHTAKPLTGSDAKNLLIGEISIQTLTGKQNP